jgi:hypothetical protein
MVMMLIVIPESIKDVDTFNTAAFSFSFLRGGPYRSALTLELGL